MVERLVELELRAAPPLVTTETAPAGRLGSTDCVVREVRRLLEPCDLVSGIAQCFRYVNPL